LDGIGTIGLVDTHRPRRADAVAVQEQHDLADHLLLGPAGDDPLRPLRADPSYLAQARRLLLDHVEHGLTEGAHQLLGVNRADAANHAGPEIFFDALGRRGRHRLEERSPELNTVSAVVDPGAARLDELAGRDHRGMAKDGDQVALAARLDPQHAEPVLLVVERDALYQASQGLGRGICAGSLHYGGDLILSATCRACEPRHRPVPLGSRLWPPIQGRPLATPSFRRVRAAR
jgi:hypothetical protein